MAIPAYNTTVKVTGSSTSLTAEPCSLVSGKTYRITNSAKRILDPATAVVVYDGGSPVDDSDILSYSPLFGTVTFQPSYTVGGAITVDGAYLPTFDLAGAREFSFNRATDLLDVSVFDATADYKRRLYGLGDFTASVGALDTTHTDMDPSGATQTLTTMNDAQTPFVVAIALSSVEYRFWVTIESMEVSGAVDGLIECSLSLQAATQGFVTDGSSVSWAKA